MDDEQVEVAVAVEIPAGAAPSHPGPLQGGSGPVGDVDESGRSVLPRSGVAKQQVALAVGRRLVDQLGVVEHVAVGNVEVEAAVEVDVEEVHSEAEKGQRGFSAARGEALVAEEAVRLVAEQGVGLALEVGHREVRPAVVVVVPPVDPHAGLGAPGLPVRGAGEHPDLGEPPPFVVEQEVAHVVVGDVEVGPSVEVVVGEGYPQPLAPRLQRARGFGGVGEPAAALVAVEEVGLRRVEGRMRVPGDFPLVLTGNRDVGGGLLHRVGGVVVDVVGDVEVDEAVAVVVAEGAAGTPVAAADPGCFGDPGKAVSAGVLEQRVGPVVGDVEIGVAVVVDVGGAAAHADAAVVHPEPRPGFLEEAALRLPEEGVDRGRFPAGPAAVPGSDRRPLHEVDVEPAVAVGVEEGPAPFGGLGEVPLGGGGVVVAEAEPHLGCDVGETDLAHRFPVRGGGGQQGRASRPGDGNDTGRTRGRAHSRPFHGFSPSFCRAARAMSPPAGSPRQSRRKRR